MNGNLPRGSHGDGNNRLRSASSGVRSGFTLLEMCMVLFIIALLFGVTVPAMQSAFTEQAVRKDSHQLALMIKTAMIQSAEQHRNYVIDLTNKTMALHPADPASTQADNASDTDTDASTAAAAAGSPPMEDVVVTDQLDDPNKLLAPDPVKADSWVDMPDTSWVFQPGELCPATRVRLSRGDAWIEMTFNALTGNVENETANFP